MELYKRDFFIARIMAGYVPVFIDDETINICYANNDIILRANIKYIQAYEKAKDQEIFDDNDILNQLIIQGIWSLQKEEEYKNIVPKHIEYWKIKLYQSVLKTKTREQVRKYLNIAKKEYNKLYNLRHYYDYVTCDGYANYVKNLFLVSECAKLNNCSIDWNKYNLNKIMRLYHSALLQSDDIRILARTTPWVGMWPLLKANNKIFDNINLTAEQQSLLSWSIMYERIYESPECPPDDVIQDDDMLDGWLLLQKQQREKDKKQSEIEGAISKNMQNADELYIPAETAEDAFKIDLLNAPHVSAIKKHRMKQLKDKGIIKQQEFKDVQQKRSMQLQQAFNQQVRRSK